ncbi:MAG: hypothetical protein M1839_003623 [Geoglossum umbratile]|nr:MAG: hypothetical protein M1839_003623 [Geoglossum umbratile]
MSEDKELLERISQVAGHINRHRNQQKSSGEDYATPGLGTPSLHSTNYNALGRHILEIISRKAVWPGDSPSPASAIPEDKDTPTDAVASSTSWVAKRDRHIQLINSSVFDKETQARARAMEETRKQKTRHKEERQRLKFTKYLQNMSSKSSHPSVRSAGDGNSHHEVVIGGVRYQVLMGGSKLQKAPDDINSAKATPKKAAIGGVTFLRSKNGNLWRSGFALVHGGPSVPTFTMRARLPSAKNFCKKGLVVLVIPAIFLTIQPHIEFRPVFIFFGGHARTPIAGMPMFGSTLGLSYADLSQHWGSAIKEAAVLNAISMNARIMAVPELTTASSASGPGSEGALNGKEIVATSATAEEESDISSGEDYDEIDSDDVDSDCLDEELTAPANLHEEHREISIQQDFIHF